VKIEYDLEGTTDLAGLPKYSGDVGLDLYVSRDVVLERHKPTLVGSGFVAVIPDGYFGLVLGRSSTGAAGIHVFPGVIDSGYLGELGARCMWLGEADAYKVTAGTRLAQLVLLPAVYPTKLVGVHNASSVRSSNGYGSTGR